MPSVREMSVRELQSAWESATPIHAACVGTVQRACVPDVDCCMASDARWEQ